MRLTTKLGIAAIAMAAGLTSVQATDFPEKGKTVTLVIPFPPGGASDVLGRVVAQKLGELWGVTTVVENRAGGESMVGAAAVANGKKDGYYIGLFTLDFVLNRIVQTSQPYDAARDFTPVAQLAQSSLVLVVNSKSEIKTFGDLKAASEKKADGLNFSSCCSVMYFSTEMLKNSTRIKGMHIPYKGSAPSVGAVVAGETDFAIDTPLSIKPFVDSGKLRALLVTSRERAPAFPQVPSLTEAGVPGSFELGTWWGILMPSGVPPQIVAKTSESLKEIMDMPDVKQKLADLGLESQWGSGKEFGQMMEADHARYAKVAKENNLVFKH
ncbi:Bug family tripartite tricarboxylate transporter substrate binding protein [Pseudorhodoferax soli]|uniref:Tripartite-type tricarboxylate transporter receptor subunit TctC n=1 Tax=Pseudorhodoferax soli TaxID=545864 RepID=A0A368XB18_9BURK|nr:tripartite tricarboxylate transporter substrate-binding protein [Pseudorhodoferax soli]RCW63214.1 tripartite-type tricarboxylate transporter receptor subunit TctC [Pseudorhodoferax soli]